MESHLKIVFLTTNDPIYLPDFFERVLDKYAARTRAVFIAPPLYGKQTVRDASWRYFRTFGWEGIWGLAPRVMRAKIRRQSIAEVCKSKGVQHAIVQNVNAPEFLNQLRDLGTNIIVSVSCPQIFKKTLIDLPSLGCLNIHGAILPHYRGIMPSFWMLANGEKQGGVSIYYVNERIDAGDLCGQRVFEILPDDTLDSFLRRSKAIAADLLREVLQKIEKGTATRIPINLSEGSYYSWPDATAVERFRAIGRRLW